ncbi:MAG: metallophosphoesterase [Nitrospiria bacterium]
MPGPYFWSDTHFNHEGILHFTTRPWKTVREMNDALLEKWNSVVGSRDEIYLLGDFAFKHPLGDDIEGLFLRLHGKKFLLRGNHDYRNPSVLKLPWDNAWDLREVKSEGRKAVCCHYPLETWASSHYGSMMLHGHSHGTLRRKEPKRFDVGVDAIGRDGPLSFNTLWEMAEREPFITYDHHGVKNDEV